MRSHWKACAILLFTNFSMNKIAEKISIDKLRNCIKRELDDSNEYLSRWLEVFVNKAKLLPDSRRPWAPRGREYLDFYETFYYVLHWYCQFKSGRFKDMGWKIDETVAENIREKFLRLNREALSNKNKNQFHEYFKNYDFYPLSLYTAIDYKFQNITGTKVDNILDFGSGIGRQAFQWCSQGSVNLFSVDAIESLYMLQNDVYSLLFPDKLIEYFYGPERFCDPGFYSMRDKLYHLPTWKLDLLPDRYFDLIICVQVLQELNKETLRFLLRQFRRIVKKNGILYIRDNEFWKPAHKLRVGRELLEQGWELIFKYTGHEGADIAGIPRLWVFTDADNRKSFRHLTRIKRVFFPSHPFDYSAWRDYGLPI